MKTLVLKEGELDLTKVFVLKLVLVTGCSFCVMGYVGQDERKKGCSLKLAGQ